MRIAIDCADLDYSRIDGTRVYIKNLLDRFGSLSPQSEFYLYHKKKYNPELEPKIFSNYKDRKIPYGWWWTQTRFPFELLRDKMEVCWMPIQQVPLLASKKIKNVVTLHDLAFKRFPDSFPFEDRFKLNMFTDWAVTRAAHIIAISEATKNDVLEFYPQLDPKKVSVVHHGFDGELFGKRSSEAEIVQVRETYKLNSKFILYVGAIQPRKNLATLIKAFENLKEHEGQEDLKLVLVGQAAWKSEETLKKIQDSCFKAEIILTGKVSFDELAIFYQAATVMVLPSLYEGFGLPILESFASGTPVVTANNSSLIEVGGEAVEKFNAEDPVELTTVLGKLLTNEGLRKELSEKGRKRLQLFSWDRCAEETLKILKNV